MSKVVNLNKFRKRRAKAEREKQAETNRRLHGRTKSEREQDELRKRQLETKIRGAMLDRPAIEPADDEAD